MLVVHILREFIVPQCGTCTTRRVEYRLLILLIIVCSRVSSFGVSIYNTVSSYHVTVCFRTLRSYFFAAIFVLFVVRILRTCTSSSVAHQFNIVLTGIPLFSYSHFLAYEWSFRMLHPSSFFHMLPYLSAPPDSSLNPHPSLPSFFVHPPSDYLSLFSYAVQVHVRSTTVYVHSATIKYFEVALFMQKANRALGVYTLSFTHSFFGGNEYLSLFLLSSII